MITNLGKEHIRKYLAGEQPQIARAVSFGVGTTAATATDIRLQFELVRAALTLANYDRATGRLVFKAKLPDTLSGKITEVALWTETAPTGAGSLDIMINGFAEEDSWSDTPVWSNANSKIGPESLRQIAPAAGTRTNQLSDLLLDLSAYSGADLFTFAFYQSAANAASIKYRFKTDASNYYEITVTNPPLGYRVESVAKSTATAFGTPRWSDITTIEVITTAKAGVVATVDLDGIGIADGDVRNPNYVMVARQVITPFAIAAGSVNEVEYSLAVNV